MVLALGEAAGFGAGEGGVGCGVGDEVCAAREGAILCGGELGDVAEELGVAAWGHVGCREAEGRIDGGGAVAALAEQGDEVVEGVAVAVKFLHGAEVGEAGAFEGGDPDRGVRADGAPGGGAAREVDAEESRVAHAATVKAVPHARRSSRI